MFGQVQWRGGKLVSHRMAGNSLASYGITWLATSNAPKKNTFDGTYTDIIQQYMGYLYTYIYIYIEIYNMYV